MPFILSELGGIMLYSKENFMLFSLIYSDLGGGRFKTPNLPHDILYRIFFHSIDKNKNIFELDNFRLESLILESAHILKQENSRIKIEKRIEGAMLYFLSEDGTENLNRLKRRVEMEFLICEKEKIKYIDYMSVDYPKNLKELKDPPFMIFYKGYFPKDEELKKSLAIIGSRNPDEIYGVEVAKRMGNFLSKNNWWNISGLALGCDKFGHIGSLEGGGKTGAILGQGLGTPIYPKENKKLANEILEKSGFLMSELPPTTPNLSIYFILRNRLQSGMTCGIFVVQTGKIGGTLHTVKYSLEQERKTIVWDSSHIEKLEDTHEVVGNKILLGDKKDKLGVSIPKELRKNIIKIKYLNELKKMIN